MCVCVWGGGGGWAKSNFAVTNTVSRILNDDQYKLNFDKFCFSCTSQSVYKD